MHFGTPDLIILGMICLSILIGVVRGFVKESISLITWVVAIGLSMLFTAGLAEYMTFTKIPLVRMISAFLIIFVGTIFVGAIINFLVGVFIRKTPFSVPDRILGSIFGLLRGMVFVTILVLLGGLTPFPETPWWQESYAVGHFQELAIWLKEQLPEDNAKVFHFPGEQKTITETEKAVSKDKKANELSQNAVD